MKTVEIMALCMVISVVSFLGFLVENIWLSVTKGYIDNRNMCLPFLIGYGLAIAAIYIMFGTPRKMLLFGKSLMIKSRILKIFLYFLIVMVCVCLGEILLGKTVEKICHFYWWDYSRLPLHITRYTSIPTSAAFSLLILTFMDHIFEPLYQSFLTWDDKILCITALCFMVFLTWDYLYNAYRMYKNKKMQQRWSIDTTWTKGYQMLHSSVK